MKYSNSLFMDAYNNIEESYNLLKSILSIKKPFFNLLNIRLVKYIYRINSIIQDLNDVSKELGGGNGIINKMINLSSQIAQISGDFSIVESISKYLLDSCGSLDNIGGLLDDDIYKDFRNILIDYYYKVGDDGSVSSSIFKKLYPLSEKCSYTGVFSDMTDFQNIFLSGSMSMYNELIRNYNGKIEGRTISELLNIVNKDKNKYIYNMLLEMKAYGFGNFKICEVIKGNDKASAFSGFVINDVNGDYNICYNATDLETSDLSFDAAVCINYLLGNTTNESLKELILYASTSKFAGDISKHYNIDFDNIQFNDENYRKLSEKYAKKYAELSKKENKKVFVTGYSLGGANAEFTTNYILKNYPNQIGEVTIYNGLNADLSKEDFDRMKKLGQDRFHVYINQGDMVSKFVQEEAFSDYAINLPMNYKKIYSDAKADIDAKGNVLELPVALKNAINFTFIDKKYDNLKKLLFNDIKYSELLISGCCHQCEKALNADLYDESGNLDRSVRGVSFEEGSNEMFGYNVREVASETLDSWQVKILSDIINGALRIGDNVSKVNDIVAFTE